MRLRPRPTRDGTSRHIHPFFRDVGITVFAQVVYALLSLLLYRLLAEETGKDGFGSYALVKQGVALLFPIVMVGLVSGLPRYLALRPEERSPTSEAYLSAAFGICGGATAAVGALALAVPEATAGLFFGTSSRDDLVVPFVALLAASSLFYLTYGYFRGLVRMRLASALQVGAFGLPPPLIVLLFPDEPIETLILLMAVVLATTSLLTVGAPLLRSFGRPTGAGSRTPRPSCGRTGPAAYRATWRNCSCSCSCPFWLHTLALWQTWQTSPRASRCSQSSPSR